MLTNAGRDKFADSVGKSAGRPAVADYIAVSANTDPESAANTTLPGEITTSGGGLVRAQATYAHTGGAATFTLTRTFIVNGSDVVPAVVAKYGVLNDPTGGTLVFEELLATTATLAASGDQTTITHTVTVTGS